VCQHSWIKSAWSILHSVDAVAGEMTANIQVRGVKGLGREALNGVTVETGNSTSHVQSPRHGQM
jgi:hypothetical protein